MPNFENLLSAQIEIKKLENYFGLSLLELIKFSKENSKDFEKYCFELGYKSELDEPIEPKVELPIEPIQELKAEDFVKPTENHKKAK